MKPIFDMKEPTDRKKMNWAQAKWANPRLKPNSDWDNDGIKNQFDCRPMNRKMQHAGKTYMVYSQDSEHLVRGKEELKSAKKLLKKQGAKDVGSYEYGE